MAAFKKTIMILMIILAVLAAGIASLPCFLAYSTNCDRADAVVLLLGPDFTARQKHGQDLTRKGMADCLVIPAYNKTYCLQEGTLKLLPNKKDNDNVAGKRNAAVPKYYEDTHLELIAAKKMMKADGLKSAIFVSSPYHMRRIQLMVVRVFDMGPNYYFSPTPYETAPLKAWELQNSDWKKVWRESVKILWFLIYFTWDNQGFGRNSGS